MSTGLSAIKLTVDEFVLDNMQTDSNPEWSSGLEWEVEGFDHLATDANAPADTLRESLARVRITKGVR